MTYLPEMDLIKVEEIANEENSATFVVEPLLPGYGATLGNSLRRVLLSSLKGAAITAVKIDDTTHEFTSVEGINEDAVEMTLNLKGVRVRYEGEEPITMTLTAKGPQTVTAGDFKTPAGLEVINKDHHIAHVEKGKTLTIEARVEAGKGYLPTEQQKGQEMPVGMIAIDAIFTPIKKIHHEVTNTRVGQKTDFDKLEINITTDGSITPNHAFKTSVEVITEYLGQISNAIASEKPKTKAKKATKKDAEVTEEAGE